MDVSKAIGFSEATYLALHAMALIAGGDGASFSIRAMAKRLGVSEAHLAKVVLRLAHSGLVKTTRGPKGGVALAKKAEDTTYLEIFEAIEGKLRPSGCVFGREECPLRGCVFRGFLTKLASDTEAWLKSNTLADFSAAIKTGG